MEVENQTTRRLLCNALLHYFYLPVVLGSLSGQAEETQIHPKHKTKPSPQEDIQISLNSALFVLNKTFEIIKFPPFLNALTIALFCKSGPENLVARQIYSCVEVEDRREGQEFGGSQEITINMIKPPWRFSPQWKFKSPNMYAPKEIEQFLAEYLNKSCALKFLCDSKFSRCIPDYLRERLEQVPERAQFKVRKFSEDQELTTPESEKQKFQIHETGLKTR